MKWVTRQGVRLDRVACAWLINRHIDGEAEISYVEAEAVADAVTTGALPFHNTTSEERDEERTSFDQLMAEYRLEQHNPALVLLAAIVRGAELPEGGEPPAEAAGLKAIIQGVNALTRDDAEMVARTAPVFDALYAYCQRQVAGKTGWANEDERGEV